MPFTNKEKEIEIEKHNKMIDSLPYASTIPYLYCCLCFDKLTKDNILERDGNLWDICLECKDK